MSAPWPLRFAGLALAAVVFALDRWIKALVTGVWQLTEPGSSLYVLPFFSFTRANNYGVSLSLLTATSDTMRWLLVGGTSLIAAVVFVWLLRERRPIDIAALGMILGGALGNILDRVRYGYVVDYADLHFGEFRPFLIFNVADAAISIGVVIILARALFMREKPPAPHGTEADQPAESS
jgi:signal peptidase II